MPKTISGIFNNVIPEKININDGKMESDSTLNKFFAFHVAKNSITYIKTKIALITTYNIKAFPNQKLK